MDQQFESFLSDLAGALKKAAECAVWDVPMNHRTKDSISAYRAAVGMVSACVVEVMEKHRAPVAVVKPVVNVPEVIVVEEPVAEPLDLEPEKLFDDNDDKPRRRRTHGDRNAS